MQLHYTTKLENTHENVHKLAGVGATFTLARARSKKPTNEKNEPLLGWQKQPYTLAQALAHLARGGNVGLLAGEPSDGLVMLDLDDYADVFVGHWPELAAWRVWREDAPKRAKLIVRCHGAHIAHAPGFDVLATGSHGIVAGTHDEGCQIRMDLAGDAPPELSLAQLDAVVADWVAFLQDIAPMDHPEPRIGLIHLDQTYSPEPRIGLIEFDQTYSPAPLNFHQVAGDPVAEAAHLLSQLAPWRCDVYLEWIRIGYAVKHTLGEAGLPLWQAWSRGSHKYRDSDWPRVWQGLKPDGRATIATLQWCAAEDTGRLQRTSDIDRVIDAVEDAVVTGELAVSANAQKTLFGCLTLMRQAKKTENVALAVRDVGKLANVAIGTVLSHMKVLVDVGILQLVRKGNWTRASSYTLVAKSNCAKTEHSPKGGGSPEGVFNFGTARYLADLYHDLQQEPICAIGARVDPELALDETELQHRFGAGVQRILTLLQVHTPDSVGELCELVHLSRRTTYRRLMALRDAGLVDGLSLVHDWRERLENLTTRLYTFGHDALRGLRTARDRERIHKRMRRYRTGEDRTIANFAIRRTAAAKINCEAMVERYNAIRRTLSTFVPVHLQQRLQKEKKAKQPAQVAKAGRKVIPTNAIHTGKGGSTGLEELRRLVAKQFLTADELAKVQTLAVRLRYNVETQSVMLGAD